MMTYKTLFGLLLSGLMAFSFVACDDDDDDMPSPDPQTIAEIAAADDQFSTLVSALERVDLVATLDGAGSFTVFAPTNSAFDALGVDLSTLTDDELTEILLYHVLGAQVLSTDLQDGQTYAGTATNTGPGETSLSLFIEKSGSSVTVNGNANVMNADITATNGVIHVIDAVLLPLDIVGHATANDQFSELVNALGTASGDLVNVLGGNGPFTVFAPLNSGFQAIADVTSGLNADQLASVLTYHVVGGSNVRSTDLTDGMMVTTVQGETFTVNINGDQVSLTDQNENTAGVVLTDVQATNGVIHVLDAVIIPDQL